MPNGDALLLRLEMQVARAGADGFGEQLIDQANNRRADVARVRRHATFGTKGEVLHFDRGRDGISRRWRFGIDAVKVLRDILRRRNLPPDAMPGRERDGTLGVEIERIAGRNDDRALIDRDGKDAMAPSPSFGKERDGAGLDAREVSAREVGLRGGGHAQMVAHR